MPDVLARPDVQRLVHEADALRRLLVDVGSDADVQLALDNVHLELGRLVHEVASPPPAPTPVETAPHHALPADDEESTASKPPMDAILTFDDTDQGRPDDDDEEDPPTDLGTPGDLHINVRAIRVAPDAAPWVVALRDHLDMLSFPEDLSEPTGVAAEVSRVQWCTVDVASRWEPFPESIQVALLGLMASRARHLRDALDIDTGPRMALERLRAYRKATDLPPVLALFPEKGPELASWHHDARRWWKALVDGLRQ